jgi:glycerophosphoryl diester phosphodiesterase
MLEIIAHRGFSAIAPENTLAAFAAALDGGADSVEFDVQLSADAVPVIFHDETFDRITGISGTVKEKSANKIKQLDAGKWFAKKYAGETIPTLADALKFLSLVKQFLYFDIKPYNNWSDCEISELIHLLITGGILEKCIMTSFNESFLQQCRQLAPQIKLGYFLVKNSDFLQQLKKAKEAGNAILSILYTVILEEPSIVEKSRSQGIDIVAWTVDKPEDFEKLVEIGVTRIITNSLLSRLV